MVMGMAEVMLGKELHPDRAIPVEKLYEIFNEHGIPYSFAAQHGIENNSFAVVRCKDCVHSFWDEENEMWKCVESAEYDSDFDDYIGFIEYHNEDFFCAYGERRTDDSRT